MFLFVLVYFLVEFGVNDNVYYWIVRISLVSMVVKYDSLFWGMYVLML